MAARQCFLSFAGAALASLKPCQSLRTLLREVVFDTTLRMSTNVAITLEGHHNTDFVPKKPGSFTLFRINKFQRGIQGLLKLETQNGRVKTGTPELTTSLVSNFHARRSELGGKELFFYGGVLFLLLLCF